MHIYTTADAPSHARAAYWNSIYSNRFARVNFEPSNNAGFEAELRVDSVGPLGIARVRCASAEIERSRTHVTCYTPQLFSFLMVRRGHGTYSHYGHETTFGAGDVTLYDSSTPARMRCSDDTEILIIRAQPDLLRPFVPFPEQLCGLKLRADATFVGVASNLAESLWQVCERGLPDRFGAAMARNLLDVLATSYAESFNSDAADSSVSTTRRIQARRFIEANLRDPELTPARIASALHISPRYLRMLFQDQKESVLSYVLRRRLEESAKQIASPLWSGRTITEIAFACGFNSAAHFTRAFRQQFGATPTGYRSRSLKLCG